LAALAALACALALAAPSVAAASDRLLAGQSLSDGQALTSADGQYELTMQSDGNLVLYMVNGNAGLMPLWAAGTKGNSGDRVVLQNNGNLAVYNATNQVLWSSNTSNPGCTNLLLQDDGNLVLDNAAHAIWATNTVQNTLRPGEQLTEGEAIYSTDERYKLSMQSDGNLVLYGPPGALWASHTRGNGQDYATMQGDGNLVIYTTTGRQLWASNTGGRAGARAVVQDDGNFVVYQGSTPFWASHTQGTRSARPLAFTKPPFQSCPSPPPSPPPPPVVVVPRPTPVPTLPRLQVRMTISWTWNRAITHLHRITIVHLPSRAMITVSCRGAGCPAHRRSVGRRRLSRLMRFLDGRTFRSGDRLVISVSKPGYRAEQVAIRIRYGRLPWVRLLS
jgi:hypothetical protein